MPLVLWPIFLLAGVFSIFFMFFSQIFVLTQVGLFFLQKVVSQKYKVFYQWTFYISSILLWLSIFFSLHNLLDDSDLTKYLTAGFPFKVFTFPCCAMGGDYVPREMWMPFYLSYIFWLAISTIIILTISKTKIFNNQKTLKILRLAYVLINLSGLGMLLPAFD